MGKQLAVVLSGGGSRGALQVGALLALVEEGLQPDLLVGTSIGAVNAVTLALHGFNQVGVARLAQAWREAVVLNLLPANFFRLTLRAMLRQADNTPAQRIREFFIRHGISEELRFGDLHSPRVLVVSADLNTGRPVLHGLDSQEKVLDGLLLSSCLPPWFSPVRRGGSYQMDGAVVSNLPVEPALQAGATEIVALDVLDIGEFAAHTGGTGEFIDQMAYAMERREVELELEIARQRGVSVRYIPLPANPRVLIWDFQHSEALMAEGDRLARLALAGQFSG